MVLAGLKDGYSQEFHGYPSLKPASTISRDIPGNILGNVPLLARAFKLQGKEDQYYSTTENMLWTGKSRSSCLVGRLSKYYTYL